LSQILGQIAGISSKGIAQREGVMQENPWMTAGKVAAGGAMAVAGMKAPQFGAAAAGGAPNLSFGPMPGVSLTPGMPAPGIVNPSPVSSIPMTASWTPTLFDYGLR
jgi:hypothetical protein